MANLYGIISGDAIWEETFTTAEKARQYAEDYTRDWELKDMEELAIVAITTVLAARVPPQRVTWEEV